MGEALVRASFPLRPLGEVSAKQRTPPHLRSQCGRMTAMAAGPTPSPVGGSEARRCSPARGSGQPNSSVSRAPGKRTAKSVGGASDGRRGQRGQETAASRPSSPGMDDMEPLQSPGDRSEGELSGPEADKRQECPVPLDLGAAATGTPPGRPVSQPSVSSVSLTNALQGLLGVAAVGGSRTAMGGPQSLLATVG